MTFIRWLVAVVVGLAGLFFFGMRGKWPPVSNTVRRASRAFKPMVLKTAGVKGASASVVHHVGRMSGRHYETPVVATPTPGGFAIALPYGRETDWLNNVIAGRPATVKTDGAEYTVVEPRIVPIAEVESYFAPKEQRAHRRFAVATALRFDATLTTPAA